MKILLPLILLIATTSAFAADPFHGTWEKNKALSGGENWVNREAIFEFKVTEERVTIRQISDGFDITKEYALNGTPTRLTEGRTAGDSESLKRIHPNVWEYRYDTHGKIQSGRTNTMPFITEGHLSVSHDGTMLIWAQRRIYEDGSSRYACRVLQK